MCRWHAVAAAAAAITVAARATVCLAAVLLLRLLLGTAVVDAVVAALASAVWLLLLLRVAVACCVCNPPWCSPHGACDALRGERACTQVQTCIQHAFSSAAVVTIATAAIIQTITITTTATNDVIGVVVCLLCT